MKQIVNDTVQLSKFEELELLLTKEELCEKFRNMNPGSFMESHGDEFDMVSYMYPEDKSGLYIRLYAPWSPNNINKCWKLESYTYRRNVHNSKQNFVYEFKTVDRDVLEWYITANLLYMFPDSKQRVFTGEAGYSIDIYSDPDFYIISAEGKQTMKVSKTNDLERVLKHFFIEV